MAELAEILGEELELPRIQPKSADNIITTKEKYTGVSRTGPSLSGISKEPSKGLSGDRSAPATMP